MRRAIALSAEAAAKAGSEPFGCVIVKDGEIVGEGFNRAVALCDPTAHSEVEAVRDACRRFECVELIGCELYASCEPCALCVATLKIARISTVYYAISLDDCSSALASATSVDRSANDAAMLRGAAGLPVAGIDIPDREAVAALAMDVVKRWARGIG